MLVELDNNQHYHWDLSKVKGATYTFWDNFLDGMAEQAYDVGIDYRAKTAMNNIFGKNPLAGFPVYK